MCIACLFMNSITVLSYPQQPGKTIGVLSFLSCVVLFELKLEYITK